MRVLRLCDLSRVFVDMWLTSWQLLRKRKLNIREINSTDTKSSKRKYLIKQKSPFSEKLKKITWISNNIFIKSQVTMIDILNFIELAIELSFQRMALTMVVYFSKWKNRCKFYFDQQPRNWGTLECKTFFFYQLQW